MQWLQKLLIIFWWRELVQQLVRAQSLPISSGPPCAVLPLWESSAGNVRMGIFPSYFHVDHTLQITQSLFQGIKWVEMLLQCLLGWCDAVQMHLGVFCRLPWFKILYHYQKSNCGSPKSAYIPWKNVISQAHYLKAYLHKQLLIHAYKRDSQKVNTDF